MNGGAPRRSMRHRPRTAPGLALLCLAALLAAAAGLPSSAAPPPEPGSGSGGPSEGSPGTAPPARPRGTVAPARSSAPPPPPPPEEEEEEAAVAEEEEEAAAGSGPAGTMLGICASVQPLTRTVGPTIGGVLYKQFGVSSFGYLQLIVNIGLFVYLLKSKIPLREMKSQ